ncbi:hypothetical protein [Brevibacterium yomogidense]|nr:hypothetical protein [Brevibacterium yomogidense]
MTTQYAPHPHTPPPHSQYPQSQPPKKQTNVIGVIALIVGVIGFVFACIPGALIIGWIMLPIAFILSLVGLFLPRKAKWSAITALIVSVVGTIVGVLVFFFVIVGAVDESFGGSDSSVVENDAAVTDEVDGGAGASTVDDEGSESSGGADAATSEAGSRENPSALGSTVTGDEWEITVVDFNAEADEEVLAGYDFNEPAAEGSKYVVAEVDVTYIGEGSSDPFLLDISYLTDSGNVVESYDTMAIAPEPTLNEIGEMYTGASGTGNVVFEVPADDEGLLRVAPGMIADDVFISTK